MNITPFVDVMLVLLIIFMVAAPIATASVPVDLPPVKPRSAPPPPVKPVMVAVMNRLQSAGYNKVGLIAQDSSGGIPAGKP
jgi:biopolymer transport protein ExbD